MSRIKKISGANLLRNAIMIPAVTNHDDADITDLEAFRVLTNKENEKAGIKVTMLAFLIKACVAALKKYPEFNSLAITAGALRTYMERHGVPTTLPLMASAPVSWRKGDETERWANQIWMLFLQLPTHIADPVERLHWAHNAATLAKENWDRMPLHMLRDASALMPGAMVASAGPMMAAMPAEMMPAIYNVAVSNVKGPRERPTYGGNPMSRYFVFGFLAPTTGLLVGGQSLGDRMIFSLTACRDIVKHLEKLPALFHQSLAELLKATGQAPEKKSPGHHRD